MAGVKGSGCGAPKGHPCYNTTPSPGRPRSHDIVKVAEDLIAWAKKPGSINFNKFVALYDPPFPAIKLIEWSHQDETFHNAYRTAKAFLAFRREELVTANLLHVKAYDLNSNVYDELMKSEKRQQQEFESKLKTQEIKEEKKLTAEQAKEIARQNKLL